MPKLFNNNLFSYPLPKPNNTLYHQLGIDPEATPAEIREAKTEKVGRLKKEKAILMKKLEEVYQEIPELRDVHEQFKKKHENHDFEGLPQLEIKQRKLEQKALSIVTSYQDIRKRVDKLEKEIKSINQINIENLEKRAEYDLITPPCALLKLEKPEVEVFTSAGKKLTLLLLRRQLVDFFEEKGMESYHPSDLTRKTFATDFSHNQLIDD